MSDILEILKANPNAEYIDESGKKRPLQELAVNQIKPHKYYAQPTFHNGQRYDSKKEAEYAMQLDIKLRAGIIAWWARKLEFTLQGGIIYRADFVEFDGNLIQVSEIKPFDKKTQKFRYTKEYRLKRRLLKERFPLLNIEEL